VNAADLVRHVTSRIVDAVDAEVWRIEQRQKWREQHTIPPGREAEYQRRELLRRHTPTERDR
jgi:hypothetical protein